MVGVVILHQYLAWSQHEFSSLKPLFKDPLKPDITHMTQNSHAVCENLTAHLLHAPAKGVVFREVPARLRVDHAVETGVVFIQVAVLVVIDAVELWILGLELLEHVTLDEKETRRAVEHLCKPILDLGLLVPEIHDERRGDARQVPALFARFDIVLSLVPHNALLRVRCARHVMTRLEETNHRLGIKVNIRVDKQKVSRLGLLHEPSNRQVSGTMDKRLILGRIKHHLNTVHSARTLETEHRLGVGLETHAAIARRGDEKGDLTHYGENEESP